MKKIVTEIGNYAAKKQNQTSRNQTISQNPLDFLLHFLGNKIAPGKKGSCQKTEDKKQKRKDKEQPSTLHHSQQDKAGKAR